MAIDINKHEVDIDTLFKQNENDLCSIKELYRKLKELEKKISQIKYIDSNLADKLKKDYEKLKRVILDENIQLQLNNRIDETKTSLIDIINDLNTQISDNLNNIEILHGNLVEVIDGKADIVVANILAEIICILTDDVKRVLKDGGTFITSGIIHDRVDMVCEKLEATGFEVIEKNRDGEWNCIVAKLK